MNNDGLATANAIGSAINTYGQLQSIDANKQAMSLRAADQKMQQEDHDMRQKAFQAAQSDSDQAREIRLNQLNAKKLRAMQDNGIEWTPENQKELSQIGGRLADVGHLMAPETGDAIDKLEGALSGKLNMNDPAVISAANHLADVQKGATEGRQVKINRIVPAQDGSGVHLGLHVTNPDGTENPNGVLTKNRSASPEDTVDTVSIQDLVGILGAAKQSRQALQNPKFLKAYMDQFDPLPKADKERWDKATYNKETGMYEQTNLKTGETKFTRDGKSDAKGGRGGDSRTANMKDIEYFRSLGYADQDAVDLVINRGASPSQEITRMAVEMVKGSKDEDGTPTVKMEDAMDKASAYYNDHMRKQIKPKTPSSVQPNPAASMQPTAAPTQATEIPQSIVRPAPQAAIDALKANPKLADQFKAKFGYLPQ